MAEVILTILGGNLSIWIASHEPTDAEWEERREEGRSSRYKRIREEQREQIWTNIKDIPRYRRIKT